MTGITLQVIFTRAATTVDGGWRITFECGESEAQAVMQLAQLKNTNLQLAVVPIEALGDEDREIDFGRSDP